MTDATAADRGNLGQEANFVSARVRQDGPAAAGTTGIKPPETVEQKYMRQTRTAVVFIAVMVGVVCALSLVAAIVMGVQLAKVNTKLSNLSPNTTSSNCASQGGTNPDC